MGREEVGEDLEPGRVALLEGRELALLELVLARVGLEVDLREDGPGAAPGATQVGQQDARGVPGLFRAEDPHLERVLVARAVGYARRDRGRRGRRSASWPRFAGQGIFRLGSLLCRGLVCGIRMCSGLL